MQPAPDDPIAEWSGVEQVPRTLASFWHVLGKRMAELEMNGFTANEQFAIRHAIDQAVVKALANGNGHHDQIAVRWHGKGRSFQLSLDGETVVDHHGNGTH